MTVHAPASLFGRHVLSTYRVGTAGPAAITATVLAWGASLMPLGASALILSLSASLDTRGRMAFWLLVIWTLPFLAAIGAHVAFGRAELSLASRSPLPTLPMPPGRRALAEALSVWLPMAGAWAAVGGLVGGDSLLAAILPLTWLPPLLAGTLPSSRRWMPWVRLGLALSATVPLALGHLALTAVAVLACTAAILATQQVDRERRIPAIVPTLAPFRAGHDPEARFWQDLRAGLRRGARRYLLVAAPAAVIVFGYVALADSWQGEFKLPPAGLRTTAQVANLVLGLASTWGFPLFFGVEGFRDTADPRRWLRLPIARHVIGRGVYVWGVVTATMWIAAVTAVSMVPFGMCATSDPRWHGPGAAVIVVGALAALVGLVAASVCFALGDEQARILGGAHVAVLLLGFFAMLWGLSGAGLSALLVVGAGAAHAGARPYLIPTRRP